MKKTGRYAQRLPSSKDQVFIGDVRDRRAIDTVMQGVDMIFMLRPETGSFMRIFPNGSRQDNIMGCENVLDSAIQHHVKKVIVLSTDKAVYPINAMGMTRHSAKK